jgi:hypothetical protein
VVSDAARYRAAATLPSGDVPEDVMEAAARRRRDLAVQGFLQLAESVEMGDFAPLERFYDNAAALVRSAVSGWRRTWEDTVAREARRTADILTALERGDGQHLRTAMLLESLPSPRLSWGMCGRLRTHDVAHPLRRS